MLLPMADFHQSHGLLSVKHWVFYTCNPAQYCWAKVSPATASIASWPFWRASSVVACFFMHMHTAASRTMTKGALVLWVGLCVVKVIDHAWRHTVAFIMVLIVHFVYQCSRRCHVCQPCVCAQSIMVVCFVRLGFMVEWIGVSRDASHWWMVFLQTDTFVSLLVFQHPGIGNLQHTDTFSNF